MPPAQILPLHWAGSRGIGRVRVEQVGIGDGNGVGVGAGRPKQSETEKDEKRGQVACRIVVLFGPQSCVTSGFLKNSFAPCTKDLVPSYHWGLPVTG